MNGFRGLSEKKERQEKKLKEAERVFNILVCDDDKEIVNAIEIYLVQEGYHVIKAYDGQQALEIMEKEEIHLLIVDALSQSQTRRHPHNLEGARDEQHTDHYSVGKVRRL